MSLRTFAASLLVGLAAASPIAARQQSSLDAPTESKARPGTYDWTAGWERSFPIHSSCNDTLRQQLEVALDETVVLAQHARDHLLRWGNSSEIARRYFGDNSTAAIGWYDRVVNADKSGMLFRCDDPDENCATQDNWAGHWRGENATEETVICPRSFEVRRHLDSVCGLGYNVAESALNTYWATDLLHRVLHVPTISQGLVEHYAETYADVIALAKNNSELSIVDSDAIQYFAIDAYAFDIAAPGIGCSGEVPEEEEESESAGSECHTHADGTVHCV